MAHILIVDDDEAMLQLVKRILEKDGHQVDVQGDTSWVLSMDFSKYNLILLDIMMPNMDGYTVCERIRDLVDCPILFLTAKTLEADIIKGLWIGADDYITKPFGANALRARVNAHLRRENREKKNTIFVSGVSFNMNAKEIYLDKTKLLVTKSEYAICEYLALNQGRVFSREQIYVVVFGYDGESDNTVIPVHIKNIRRKFLEHNKAPIETVWGVGYKWV
ncbi:DNA-binding response OmpR family regulator [Natranaerovirga hydrolytica]|uniref:Stage 0 sporulation protein A homolog n=1 Tax=Natranaerovirga hydrolytica TaxID=680378 RepID=A0A4R1ML76_9FIRM|nr:response regulator transcription factor [Natranaerovirga hydrolytica]TCK92592.1 DNA-binding response OmpR family regulator [Natranaerovirga hydrolytica]